MNEDVMLRADEKKINWYPGHMARAKRALADQLSRVDVVVELCDARIPRASRNPDLADMIKNKRHLLVKNLQMALVRHFAILQQSLPRPR